MQNVCLWLCCLSLGWVCLPRSIHAAETYDVVVYGGTSAGVIAGVQAKKMGKSVVIVGPDKHLGGLSAGGLGWTDSGNKAVIGGLSREFYHRVWEHYNDEAAWVQQTKDSYGNKGQGTEAIDGDSRTMWIFEPHVAEKAFESLIRDFDIPVHRDEWLNRESGVTLKDGRITSITMLSGKTYVGKMFIDATYEGDLMAAAGVDYHVGREANAKYGEKWNGVQTGVLHHGHYFKTDVSPYKIPGDPKSGLLARISTEDPGVYGEEDHRVQAYCYRMCLTNVAENRVPFPKPEGYDADQYELMLRVLATGWRDGFSKFDPIPNHKTDTNNHGPFSTDNIGYNYEYPDGSYEKRQEIVQEHVVYQQGYMYFLANDPRVPEDVREKFQEWGLAKNEFTDNGNWPHQIYVREARRMIGPWVVTEHDCLNTRVTPDSVGMGSYTMDSHNVQRYIKPDGFVQNEGDIGVGTNGPYSISYQALTPKKEQCENLLVPVCLSSSHIAFGSIRMEPVFMILGQSAATAAVLSIDKNIAVQDLTYEELQPVLLKDGQVLEYDNPRKVSGIDEKSLEGIVVDDEQAQATGNWTKSRSTGGYLGYGYLHDGDTEKGKYNVRFEVKLPKADLYELRVSYSPNSNRATNVPVEVTHAAGVSMIKVNQKQPPMENGFKTLGKFTFEEKAIIDISNSDTNGHVIVDGVQLIQVEETK